MKRKYKTSAAVFLVVSGLARASDGFDVSSLSQLNLEELQNISVSSVAKKRQRLFDSAAAVYVITSQDIARSGKTTIPELLRTVPGMNVARLDSNKWAVSARGFNNRAANKLLVMVDGRTIYSPDFSGVFWSSVDTRLEDIDRIEIVRGAGGTMWGANAVNGVINIITKSAQQTAGEKSIAALGGNGISGINAASTWDDSTRVYAKAAHVNESAPRFDDPQDHWNSARLGVRSDQFVSARGQLTVAAELAGQHVNERNPVFTSDTFEEYIQDNEYNNSNGFLLSKYKSTGSNGQESSAQFFIDYSRHNDVAVALETWVTDVDLQHQIVKGSHEMTMGFNARVYTDKFGSGRQISAVPSQATRRLYSMFFQDEFHFSDATSLIIGNKVEYNDFTGTENLPNVRLITKLNANNIVWAAASRSIRVPNRLEREGHIWFTILQPGEPDNPFDLPIEVMVQGNPKYELEKADSFEVGYRSIFSESLYFDASVFRTHYGNGISFESSSLTREEGYYRATQMSMNKFHSDVVGAELLLKYSLTESDFELSLSSLDIDTIAAKDSTDHSTMPYTESSAPAITGSLKFGHNLSPKDRFDLVIRHVGRYNYPDVRAYTEADINFQHQFSKNMRANLLGENLLHPHHLESFERAFRVVDAEIRRTVTLGVNYTF